MKELNPNAKLWVEALRSGEYNQGRSWLAQTNASGTRHCCLGVACELFIKAGGKLRRRSNIDGVISYGGDSCALAPEVQHWLGLADRWGRWDSGNNCALYERNDNGSTFAEIADIIESQPEGLFA